MTVTPYKKTGKISLFLKDCMTGMSDILTKESVDVIVTSPPYKIGINYQRYDDNLPKEKYLQWIENIGSAIKYVLKPTGSFFLNIGNKPTEPLIPFEVALRLGRQFKLQNVIHWIKSIAISQDDIGEYPNIHGNIAVGHFKPIVSKKILK